MSLGIGSRAALAVLLAVTFSACAHEEPGACQSAIDAATDVYLGCAEELGVAVLSFDLSPHGDVEVEFAPETTEAQAQLVLEACEPPMEETFTLFAIACEHVEVGVPASAERLLAQVDEAARDGFSGNVLIVREGRVVVEASRGLADRMLEIENDPSTAFDVGSIMKDFTALAVFRLEQEGLLSREDTLDLWFDAPADKKMITIQQLLDHEAGLHEYHDTMGDFEPMTKEEALERIFSQSLLFEPGAAEAYSNSGYTLLAALIENVTGTTYLAYMRALWDEAGFFATGTYADELWEKAEVAVGYGNLQHGPRNSPFDWGPPSWALVGNGGLVSTLADIDHYLATIERAPGLDMDAQAAYRRDYLRSSLRLDKDTLYTVGGAGDLGFTAEAGVVPATETRVIVLSNDAEGPDTLLLAAQLLMSASGALIEVQLQ